MLTHRRTDATQERAGLRSLWASASLRAEASSLTARDFRRRLALIALGPALLLLISVISSGCSEKVGSIGLAPPRDAERATYVVSLGNLRTGQPASPTAVKVAVFLFGEEPEPPLGLVKPVEIAATSTGLIASDSALQAVLQWRSGDAILDLLPLLEGLSAPSAVAVTPDGERLIADQSGPIARVSLDNRVVQRFVAPEGLRPGGIAIVGSELWVSNILAHRIEVFDLAAGTHLRSFGQRGRGRGEFGMPMGLATTPDGNVCVVDMLNARVQVLSPSGEWKFDVGGPGDRIGYFGRPKGVAVGPDGAIFVTDAASQCIHAFDRFGRPLITFGGSDDGEQALVLPAGVTVFKGPVTAERATPGDFGAAYYVLVAEQIKRPGIRAYGWSGRTKPVEADVDPSARPRRVAPTVENPHWDATKCTACHREESGQLKPIAPRDVDATCIACHDGVKSVAESHPSGWPAKGPRTKPPDDWPLNDGRITCLTCHDIRKHCDASAARPEMNSGLVRGYDPRDPTASCHACHLTTSMRVNPHKSRVEGLPGTGATCTFCHLSIPPVQAGSLPLVDPRLRGDATGICLGCHSIHADPAPDGHLRKVVPSEMLARIERQRMTAETAAIFLPLDEGRVSCSTCHNPHATDFDPNVPATDTQPTMPALLPHHAHKLRVDYVSLCAYCHGR